MALGLFLKTIFFCPCQRPLRFYFSGLFFQDYFLLILPEALLKNFLQFETYFLGTLEALHKISTQLGTYFLGTLEALHKFPTNSELIFLVHQRCCSKFHLILIPLSQKAGESRNCFCLGDIFSCSAGGAAKILPNLGNLHLIPPKALPKFP